MTALLLCAIATREFPELLQLVDQTSNDFTILKASTGVYGVSFEKQKSNRYVFTAAVHRSERILQEQSVLLSNWFVVSSSSSDPLLLTCVLRT
jgi:hypothetical protein